MISKRLLAVLPLFLLASACGEEFDPGSRVTDFRLIAERADKPYAAPGESVTLTTLANEPFGRPVTWAFATCVRPSSTTANACLDEVVERSRVSGQSPFVQNGPEAAFTTKIPENVLDGVAPANASSVLVGILSVGCPGAIGVKDLGHLTTGEIPFRCIDNGKDLPYERFSVSVKRVYVRRTERNANPTFTGVTFDGAAWAENDIKEVDHCSNDPVMNIDLCTGGTKHDIALAIPPDAAESGISEAGKAFHEDVIAQYYGTEGLFQFDARTQESPKTQWVARAASAGKELTLFFVVRDNRGGVDWTSRKVRVR